MPTCVECLDINDCWQTKDRVANKNVNYNFLILVLFGVVFVCICAVCAETYGAMAQMICDTVRWRVNASVAVSHVCVCVSHNAHHAREWETERKDTRCARESNEWHRQMDWREWAGKWNWMSKYRRYTRSRNQFGPIILSRQLCLWRAVKLHSKVSIIFSAVCLCCATVSRETFIYLSFEFLCCSFLSNTNSLQLLTLLRFYHSG